MGAIFGILNLDGRPADRHQLLAMQAAMADHGPDGSAIWADGPLGLGHLTRHNTPESVDQTLPSTNARGDVAITAECRLDNRAELYSLLNVHPAQEGLPDSSLILGAYEKWGTDCLPRLLGDWSFAIWDRRLHRLFLARDHFGVTGFYLHRSARWVVFASSLKGLFAVDGVPRRLNPSVMPGSEFRARDPDAFQYDEIGRLRPAQAMTITPSATRRWHYWNPDDAPEIRYASDEEYVEAFTDVFRTAVHCRLRSNQPVASLLSGGLDSSSITALAAQEFASRGQRLRAFTAAPFHDVSPTTPRGRVGDESDNARTICDFIGNVDLTVIRALSRTPLQAIEEAQAIHDLPRGNANYGWILEIMETAQRQGIGVVLDGWGGNFTISWKGNRHHAVRELFTRRAWSAGLRELTTSPNARKGSRPKAMARHATNVLLPPTWLAPLRRRSFRRAYVINVDARRTLREHPGSFDVDTLALDDRNPPLSGHFRGGGFGATAAALGAAFDLEIRQPALDKRVIEFCQGVPLDQFSRDGTDRLLIRRAMAGVIPEPILRDDLHGLQAADIGQQIRADTVEIADALRQLAKSAVADRYVDFQRLRHAFDHVCFTLDRQTVSEGQLLLNGLALATFLATFEGE